MDLEHDSHRITYKSPKIKNLFKVVNEYVKSTTVITSTGPDISQKPQAIRKELNFIDIVVRCNKFYCQKKHHIQDVIAVFMVADKSGNIKEIALPAGYCEDCNVYFVLEKTYEALKKFGNIMHRIIEYHIFSSGAYLNNPASADWAPYSPLRIAGYTVNVKDNLSNQQRHLILEYIVDSGILTKSGVLMYRNRQIASTFQK